MSKNHCPLRRGRYPCDLYSRCSVWAPCVSTQLSALCRTKMRSLSEIPGFSGISWQTFSTRCCYTSVIDRHRIHQSTYVSPRREIRRIKVRGSCRTLHWTSASCPLFTGSLVQVLPDSAEKMRRCPIMHEPHVLLKRHTFQEYWWMIHQKENDSTLQLLVCSVRQLVQSKMLTQTLTHP
jgi:hypothetical protein